MELPGSLLATDVHVNASYGSMADLFTQVEKEEKFLQDETGLMTIPSGNSIHMRNQEVLDLLCGNGVREMKRKIEDEDLPPCFEVIRGKDDLIITVKFDFDKAGGDFPRFDEKTLEHGMTIRQLEFYLAVLDLNYENVYNGQAVVDSDIKPDMLIYAGDELKSGEFVVGFRSADLILKNKIK